MHLDAVADALTAAGGLLCAIEDMADLDLNPVIALLDKPGGWAVARLAG